MRALLPTFETYRAANNLAADNVRPGEHVLIVTSTDQHAEIHEALFGACDLAGAGSVASMVLGVPADLRNYRHPPAAHAAAAAADLTIVATSILFPRAYDDLTRAILDAGRRLVLINNAPPLDFSRGAALADPAALRRDTRALAARVSEAAAVRVTSPNGTDLTVGVNRSCLPLTGHAEEDTGFGSFPSGEAMLAAAEDSAEGVFVADAFGQVVYLDGAGPQLGLLEDPIRLSFAAGRLSAIEGGRAARRLEAILAESDGEARRLGELGLGTNPAARAVGHVENKFRAGSAHIALGDNHLIGWRGRATYGGRICSNRHIDLVCDAVSVEIIARA